MNIALLSINLAMGGCERTIALLSRYFTDQSQRVSILLFENIVYYDIKENVTILNSPASRNILIKAWRLYYRIISIRKFYHKYAIDYSISFLEGPNIANIISSWRITRPIICIRSFGSINHCGFVSVLYSILIYFLYKRAYAIVVVSEEIKKKLTSCYRISDSKIHVIYNMFDEENVVSQSKLDPGVPIEVFSDSFLMVGRLTKAKGHENFLRIFQAVKKMHQNLKLLIIGDGELRSHLLIMAQRMGFSTYSNWNQNAKLDRMYDIYFFGAKENPYSYMSRSQWLILSSLWEGLPNVLIEGLICGVPIISSDCKSGPREILAPGTSYNFGIKTCEYAQYGILMPVINQATESYWAQKLCQLYDDRIIRIRYSEMGHKRGGDFSIDHIGSQWIELISDFQ